jgi:hypothetical protein
MEDVMVESVALFETAARQVWSLLVAARPAVDGCRLTLVGAEYEAFTCRPGQWLRLTLPTEGRPLRRIGRIEAFDPEELRLDLALSDPAAEGWAETAAIGDPVMAELVAA